ncbi:hypothetical protein [African swine fever virus]
MKVIVFLLVLLEMQRVIQNQPFPGTGELPMTRRPPKRELEYWCTYARSCDFCWNCRHGVCKNKVFEKHPLIKKNDYIQICRVSRYGEKCSYFTDSKIRRFHIMSCTNPTYYDWFDELMQVKEDRIIDVENIKHTCLCMVATIALMVYIRKQYSRMRMQAATRLLIFLGIYLLLGILMTNIIMNLPLSTDNPMQMRRPPKEDLKFWCTYAKHCDFCWTCKDGMCKNKVFKDHPTIIENDYIVNCTVSRWHDRCMYEAHFRIHYQHNMNCSQPTELEWFTALKRHVINQDDL